MPDYRFPLPLKAAAPAVLQREPVRVEVRAGARADARADIELQGIVPVERERHGQAHPRIAELVVLLHVVDRALPAHVVRRAEGGPDAFAEVVADVELRGINRVLHDMLPT